MVEASAGVLSPFRVQFDPEAFSSKSVCHYHGCLTGTSAGVKQA
jgi:hypothetical protein